MIKFAIGFINNKAGKRIGIRTCNLKTKQVSEVAIPKDADFLNLHIKEGKLIPKHCLIADFPVFTGDILRDCLPGVKGAGAWVLTQYTDGRLMLLSTAGQMKTVTNATAKGFHNQYKIVGCSVGPEGSLVPSHSYIPTSILESAETMDKEGARAVLTLSYDLGTDMTKVLFEACEADDIDLVKLLVVSELVDIHAKDGYALRFASEYGHKEVVELLLDNGANVHVKNDYALGWASEKGHKEVVELLLDNGANVHAENDYALRWASRNGHKEVVELLLDNGANVHADTDYALRYASEKGHTGVVELLLSNGADVHANDGYVVTIAVEKGYTEIVGVLLDKGLDIHADDDFLLRYASELGQLKIVKLLLDRGADIHGYFEGALILATKNGHREVVELLVVRGANIHASDDAALRSASEHGHTEIVKLLLDNKANVHADKGSALTMARMNGHKEVEELLLSKQDSNTSEVTTLDKEGARSILAFKCDLGTDMTKVFLDACRTGDLELVKLLIASELVDIYANSDTALKYACENGYKELVKLLVSNGANVHSNANCTLRYAVSNGYGDLVKLLLSKGVDIRVGADTALRSASAHGHKELVELFLARGANVHAESDSSLRDASENGHTEVVKVLVDNGANIHVYQDDALRMASENGHIEVVKLLLDRGADKHAKKDAALKVARRKGHKEIVKLLEPTLTQGEKLVQNMIDSVEIPEDPREARIQAAGAIQALSGVPLAGLTICVTGRVDYGTREDLHNFIESKGGKIASSVTKGVDYLITNTPFSGSSKNKNAQANGCHIISEPEFMQMVRTGKRPADFNNTPKPAAPYVAQVYGTVRGKTFCITGRVNYPGKRAALQTYIRSLGGYNADKVEYGVDYLITNDPFSGSSKNKEANRIGCKVITEEQFLDMAKNTR